ncbi:MAG: DUF4430 domain-containing protein [Campylobacterota bacterium]
MLLSVFAALSAQEIDVTLIYGDGRPERTVRTEYTPGATTALELLKKVSLVETEQKGKYTFVRSIDGKKSVVGKFGWFYLIDGQSVHTMAQNYTLEDAKTMTWLYKVEACY